MRSKHHPQPVCGVHVPHVVYWLHESAYEAPPPPPLSSPHAERATATEHARIVDAKSRYLTPQI